MRSNLRNIGKLWQTQQHGNAWSPAFLVLNPQVNYVFSAIFKLRSQTVAFDKHPLQPDYAMQPDDSRLEGYFRVISAGLSASGRENGSRDRRDADRV
jgi:hypothetical protein